MSSVHIEIIKNIDQKLAIAREVINQEAPDEEAIEEAYYGLQDALDKIDSNRLAYDKQKPKHMMKILELLMMGQTLEV